MGLLLHWEVHSLSQCRAALAQGAQGKKLVEKRVLLSSCLARRWAEAKARSVPP